MNQDELRFRGTLGLMLESDDRNSIRDPVSSLDAWKPILIKATLPEISCNRQ